MPSQLEEMLAFQIKALELQNPQREYGFHDGRKWRADFAWPEIRLLVEVEGGEWQLGRHNRAMGYSADCEKYNQAALDGWTVLRFTGAMVRDGRAIRTVEQVVRERYDRIGRAL